MLRLIGGGGSVKAMYVPIPISHEVAGKNIKLCFDGEGVNNGNFMEVVIGDKRGIHAKRIGSSQIMIIDEESAEYLMESYGLK